MIDSCDCERFGPGDVYTSAHSACSAFAAVLEYWRLNSHFFNSIPILMTALAVSQLSATSAHAGMHKGVAALVTVVLSLLGLRFGFSSPFSPGLPSSLYCSSTCVPGWLPELPTIHGQSPSGYTAL